jgi:hypothetical protein
MPSGCSDSIRNSGESSGSAFLRPVPASALATCSTDPVPMAVSSSPRQACRSPWTKSSVLRLPGNGSMSPTKTHCLNLCGWRFRGVSCGRGRRSCAAFAKSCVRSSKNCSNERRGIRSHGAMLRPTDRGTNCEPIVSCLPFARRRAAKGFSRFPDRLRDDGRRTYPRRFARMPIGRALPRECIVVPRDFDFFASRASPTGVYMPVMSDIWRVILS